jgi:hypothetical protein
MAPRCSSIRRIRNRTRTAGTRAEQAELTALLTTLKHAASMPNPLFCERQRRRTSTRGIHPVSCKLRRELDGGLILPRGLHDTVATLANQADGRLEVTDDRAQGTAQEFTFHATLTGDQPETVAAPTRYDLATLVAPPGANGVRFSILQRSLLQLACPPTRQRLSLRQSPACRRSR